MDALCCFAAWTLVWIAVNLLVSMGPKEGE